MKRVSLFFLIAISTSILLNSCSTSNDVVSNHRIQKRKYNKGFFIQKGAEKSNLKKNQSTEDILVETKETPEIIKQNFSSFEASPKIAQTHEEKHLEIQKTFHKELVSSNAEKPLEIKPAKKDFTSFEKKAAKMIVSKEGFKTRKIHQKVLSKTMKKVKSEDSENDDEIDPILLYVLCFLLPPVAVGLATNWSTNDVILNIVLCLLCGLPGIIHAFIVVSKNV